MTPAHRAHRGPRLSSNLTTGRYAMPIALAVVIIGALAAIGALIGGSGGGGTPRPAAAISAPPRHITPQSRQGYFAALYTDATIGPRDLAADNALKLGEHVCADLRGGADLAGSYAYVRDTTKLARMQAARLVDAADRQLCPR